MTHAIRNISSVIELNSCMNVFIKQPRVAIDLEFDKNHFRYGFNLCLIQLFSVQTGVVIIDPLAVDNLSSFFELVNDNNVEKVTYAFGEDLRLLFDLGCQPKNIVDISIARGICGYENLSLTNALIQEIDVHSSNDFQRSNWCERPLTDEQLLYAAEDVLFLFELQDKVIQEVKRLNRLHWLEGEMKHLETPPIIASTSLESFYHKEMKEMTLAEWERFKALLEVREQLAESIDRPTYKVIDRAILVEIAKTNSFKKWQDYKRVHRKIKTVETLQWLISAVDAVNSRLEEIGMDALKPARKPMSYEERLIRSREKNKIAIVRESILVPIKARLDEIYGDKVSTLLLSKRQMDKIVTGDYHLPAYRKTIFRAVAKELSLEIDGLKFL